MRKSKKTEEPSNQYLEVINNKYRYFGPDYKFTLTDEKYHNYATLVINPSHIKIVKNETSKSNQELKEQIGLHMSDINSEVRLPIFCITDLD